MKSFEKLFHDSDFYKVVMEVVAKVAYKDLRSDKSVEQDAMLPWQKK